MVNSVAAESCSQVNEEQIHTDTFDDDISRVEDAVGDLMSELTSASIDITLLKEVIEKTQLRHANRHAVWSETVSARVDIPHQLSLTRAPRFQLYSTLHCGQQLM